MAGQIFSAYKETLERFPVALPEMTNGLMHFGPSPVQIIISGPENDEKTQALIQVSEEYTCHFAGFFYLLSAIGKRLQFSAGKRHTVSKNLSL